MLEQLDVLEFFCSWLQLYQQILVRLVVQYASVQSFFSPQIFLCHLRNKIFPRYDLGTKKGKTFLK